jgi:hypothetical protein
VHSPNLWAAMTLFWAAVTATGIVGVFLEAAGHGWWLMLWAGGMIFAVVSAHRWETQRKRRLTMASPETSDGGPRL